MPSKSYHDTDAAAPKPPTTKRFLREPSPFVFDKPQMTKSFRGAVKRTIFLALGIDEEDGARENPRNVRGHMSGRD